MKILLVTSPRERCGIREYGKFLMDAVKSDPEISITEFPNPEANELGTPECDIIHLNHHAALHSSWTEERVEQYQKLGYKVVVTQHDTFEDFGVMLERGFPNFLNADGLVVHEPVEGLTHDGFGQEIIGNVWYIPQGVLPPANLRDKPAPRTLGTVGFDFPWKNYNMVARVTKEAGWVFLLIAPEMSQERVEEIKGINPESIVITSWVSAEDAVVLLAGCTATGFLYSTGNSGTSGAIRLGVAARRPMVAFQSRQNRDLLNESAIYWAEGEEQVGNWLENVSFMQQFSGETVHVHGMAELAEKQSWTNVGKQYKKVWLNVMEER